jgi:hypothetical protein
MVRDMDFRTRVSGLGFRVSGFGFRGSGLGFWVAGLEFLVLGVSLAAVRVPRDTPEHEMWWAAIRARVAAPKQSLTQLVAVLGFTGWGAMFSGCRFKGVGV